MRHFICLLLVVGLLAYVSLADGDIDDSVVVTNEEDDEAPAAETVAVEEDDDYRSPVIGDGSVHFREHFDDLNEFNRKWVRSETKKDDSVAEIAQYDGLWSVEAPIRRIFRNDLGLVLKSKVKHAAISSKLSKPFKFTDKPLVVQYEVQLQDGQECGGSYLKLLSTGLQDLTKFNDKTPYTIMFGPDKCGNDIKLHFIFRHKNPLNGSIEEKHCRKPKDRLEEPFKDKLPHLYTLVVRPDNTYTIKVDHRIVNEGSLLADFTPAVNPPKEIDDPTDAKPTDWDEREKINDPISQKPVDWDEDAPPQIPDEGTSKPDGWLDDEETMISDPSAIKPDDWDTDMDGDWEAPLITNPICEKAVGCGLWKAPLIANPNYRGKWRAPLIDNPNYQGKWAPRLIPNPDFFEDLKPFQMTPITAIGFELWSISGDILFDNIIVTDSEAVAEQWAAQSYDLKKQKLDTDSKTIWERTMRYMNYKPGWWALYFFYCSIPIGVYVWYLSRRAKEESFVTRIVNYTNDNPYLWAVYVVFGGLPLAFLAYYCCKEKPTSYRFDNEASAQANNKKTDAPTADDPESSGDETGALSDKKQATTALPTETKTDKAELNAVVDDDAKKADGTSQEEDGQEDDNNAAGPDEEEDDEDDDDDDDDDDDGDEEDSEPLPDLVEDKVPEVAKPIEKAESTRRRKPRKE